MRLANAARELQCREVVARRGAWTEKAVACTALCSHSCASAVRLPRRGLSTSISAYKSTCSSFALLPFHRARLVAAWHVQALSIALRPVATPALTQERHVSLCCCVLHCNSRACEHAHLQNIRRRAASVRDSHTPAKLPRHVYDGPAPTPPGARTPSAA